MFSAEEQAVELKIRAYCAANNLPVPEEFQWTSIPFTGGWGISTSFFQLAALEARSGAGPKKPVPQRAQEIAAEVAAHLDGLEAFDRAEAVRGYLNLYFAPGKFSRRVIDSVLAEGQDFGCGEPKNKQIMVEYSQPNTHKAFHVGHLRSAILGDTVSRILACAGYDVIRANYIGDIGMHVMKWLWNYITYHAGERPPKDSSTRWMGELYAEANRRLEAEPELEEEVRRLYTRWDERDPEIVALWEETRQWSLDGFNEMYALLNIHFDRYYYPSETEAPGKAIVQDLIRRGIAQDERPEGPVIVRIDELLGLDKEKYRVLVVLRSNGTALYSTEDLALAVMKFTEYPELDTSLYVVDVRQSLHFQQVFQTLEIAGYPWATRCQHLSYELVNLPGNVVLASREGAVVLLEDLVAEAVRRAREVVEEKNPDLTDEQKQDVSFAVGLGALRYPMLARDNTKLVTFDWETALDFNGQAAPYIQYAHVRANSILRRMETALPDPLTPEYTLEPSEIQLIETIARLPGEVQRAAAEYKPLIITNQAYELAKAFTDFYNACPVLKAEPEKRGFRLRLTAAARQAIANSLQLLGIQVPDVM